MEYPIPRIIEYFSEASIQFVDIMKHTISSYQSFTGYTSSDCSELIITLAGCAAVIINGTYYDVKPGTLLHTGANIKLDLVVKEDEPWNYAVLQYRINQEDEMSYPMYKEQFLIPSRLNESITQYIDDLTERYISPNPLTNIQAKVLFFKLIETLLISIQQCTQSKKSELMLQAVQYMHLRYNRPLSVTHISQYIGVERRRFAYLFERYTGMTPNHYLTSFRMKRSRELLRAHHYSVAEVAELVGYHDSFYFSRVFKKYNGVSPSDYRRKLNISS
ncbi:helix-turn-helix domain-containing protein [Paenibacillus endoradicis]|uniref:helix-turn-helix domain-containing protein n=1 Tax=Paenibacillus endoradicis TaxID=2972487 RepID=UPI0021591D44|nr:AraC family transcriptional regulator [Paenibacillus endoradicis]MCR8658813.1 AraC family transcriptional regulator [Paenibacillus endoradicis]